MKLSYDADIANFRSINLEVLFWQSLSLNNSNEIKKVIQGNLFIHFSTLLSSIVPEESTRDKKVCRLEKNIMLNGSLVGKANLKMELNYEKFLEQKIAGVYTGRDQDPLKTFK